MNHLQDGGAELRKVSFPDDGHPVMRCECLDLCGDERDGLIVRDYHGIYICAQADDPGLQTYCP